MPVSMTYLTPGIVIDVSAMFVARMTFLHPEGAGLKAFICLLDGKAANKGQTINFGCSKK